MCTTRIQKLLTKDNLRAVLNEGSVISYSVTNAVLYVKEPSKLLQDGILRLLTLIDDSDESANEYASAAISYSIIGFASLCLALQNYKSYSKIIHDYSTKETPEEEEVVAAPIDEELGELFDNTGDEASPEIKPKKTSRCESFKSHTASLLKTVGASYSWFKLVKEIPLSGMDIVAGVTTALSVPGNIHSQIALLSTTEKKEVELTPGSYRRLGS